MLKLIGLALLCGLVEAREYRVDCSGMSETANVWKSLDQVNDAEFAPGDSILIKRATTCEGALHPRGSGTAEHPIVLASYGEGALPVINAKGAVSAFSLFNQHHWEIRNVELTGSTEYGIYVSGDQELMEYFRISDLVVHGVHSKEKMKTKISGLVVFDVKPGHRFEDIVIDGVTAFDTNRWAGIVVQGGGESRKVTVRNSTVHNVDGDGIILFSLREGLIERSAAWYTGMELRYSIGSPNSIWTWACKTCAVRLNEGYFSDSPTVDGGVYDIDFYNDRNLVEDNFGHDSQGYCVAVFGAGGATTTTSEVRRNLCAGNGRSPRLASQYGDVYLYTWNKGSLNGVSIHDNTILWSPPIDAPALSNDAAYVGTGSNRFHHNMIVSDVPTLVRSNASLQVADNQIVRMGKSTPEILRLPEPRTTRRDVAVGRRGSWNLISFLTRSGDSRSQAVVLRSAAFQYRGKGLRTAIVSPEPTGLAQDWKLEGVEVVKGRVVSGADPLTILLDPEGRTVYEWKGYAPAKEVIFAVRKALGPPR